MSLESLEKQGYIKKMAADKKEVADVFGLAKRDLKLAGEISERSLDWAFNIAYNAFLQAARSLLLLEGYRTTGEAQHVAVIEFLKTRKEKEISGNLLFFDKIRRKRHKAVYGQTGIVSDTELENAIRIVTQFVNFVEKTLKTKGIETT